MVMAPAWGSGPNGAGQQPAPPRQPQGPPPICFKCGLQGHFVVNCPQAAQENGQAYGGPAPSHAPQQGYQNGPGGHDGGSSQGAHWPSHQSVHNYPDLQSYPAPAPPAPQYQQYHAPQGQPYPHPQQGAYQHPSNHPYGPSGGPQGYSQPPQPYGGSAPASQYGNQGYYPAQYNQYPQQGGPPQQAYQGGYQDTTQQYAPPYSATTYEQGPSSYPQGGPYQQPQWNPAPAAPYGTPPFQQPNNPYGTQYNQGRERSTSGTRNQFRPHQPPRQDYGPDGARPSQHTAAQAQHGTAMDALKASDPGVKDDSAEEKKRQESNPLTQGDFLDENFKWEMEKVFKETPPTENVELAQPLSTKFDMTPVPLINAGPPPSVSRYARKDNVKEFVRPIRSQPQWSYLQEDPAFAETNTDGELIPLGEVLDWMAKRQDVEPQTLSARKIKVQQNASLVDTASVQDQSFTVADQEKQQVSEGLDHEMSDASVVRKSDTPATVPGTPAAPGTPTLETVDDVWAPQPGEGASCPAESKDPTEALLASLGVTGSPKPVRKRSVPHLSISTDEFSSRKRPKTTPSRKGSGYGAHSPPADHGNSQSNHYATLNKGPPYNKPHHKKGGKPNYPAHDNRQYGTPTSGPSSYGNGGSPTSGSPFNNGPYSSISPHSQLPPDYRNSPGGAQTPSAHGHPQHGVTQQAHGPPHFQDPWAASNRGNRHGQQRHARAQNEIAVPYGNGNGNGTPTGSNGPHGSPVKITSPHAKPQHQPFNTSQGNPSSRRNSWNGIRRGSHSKRIPHGQMDHGEDTPSSPAKTPIFSEGQNSKTSDTNEPDESPLTPTSAEILGKLTQPYRNNSSDKRADETRRPRRPQPVVEEAYSRRW